MDDIITLIEQDLGQCKRIGGWQFWHCPFHAGDNTPSLAVRNNRYYCFACRANGDAVDWLVSYRRMTMREALQQVKGQSASPKPAKPAKPKTQDIPPLVKPDDLWQSQALDEVLRAHDALLNKPEGEPVRKYLLGRGLKPETWQAWVLGAGFVYSPATGQRERVVVCPYFDGQAQITAVKYRFLSSSLRYTSRKGSKPDLYGLWQAVNPVLVVCEGEINAMSVWQVVGEWVTVVSPGSQSAGRERLKALLNSGGFWRTLVWFDEPESAAEYARLADTVLSSPSADGVKLDANEMLKRGILGEFINRALQVKAGVGNG